MDHAPSQAQQKIDGADLGAPGSSRFCDHCDAIDMELTSRFVGPGKETLYLDRKPLIAFGSIGNRRRDIGVEVIYLVLLSGQFRDIPPPSPRLVVCKLRAE